MMLTAAKFHATPTTANARLLFRASLLHLPIFMTAFLLHRLPRLLTPPLLLPPPPLLPPCLGRPSTRHSCWPGKAQRRCQ